MKDDFIDELYEYDQVMNDGEIFHGKKKSGKEPGGGGCLTMLATLTLTIAMIAFIVVGLTGCGASNIDPSNIDPGQQSSQQEEVQSEGQSTSNIELNGPYKVVKVVDGDTLRVMIDGKETKVRFIGVNTPESVHNDESKNTDEGKQASDWLKELLDGEKVYLEYDVDPEDKYGRTLAYVYLDDGETMVQRLLLEEGLATTTESFDNVKYKDEFKSLMKEAKANKAGFWGTGFFH